MKSLLGRGLKDRFLLWIKLLFLEAQTVQQGRTSLNINQLLHELQQRLMIRVTALTKMPGLELFLSR